MIRRDPAIIEHIRAQRKAAGISRRPVGRPFPQRYPVRFERLYAKLLQSNVSKWRSEVRESIFPYLESWFAEAGTHRDAWPEEAKDVIDGLHLGFEPNIQNLTIDFSNQTASWHDKAWRASMKNIVSVDIFKAEPWLNPLLTSWAIENDRLQKKLSSDTRDEIRRIVNTGLTTGKRHETIRKELLDGTDLQAGIFKKVETRAKLIARDQIGKLNSAITENRQTQLGIEGYIWRTALDERVRGRPGGFYPDAVPSHWDREGQKYRWDKPPVDGHPGQAIQCRCVAEPDLSFIEDTVTDTAKPLPPALIPVSTAKRTAIRRTRLPKALPVPLPVPAPKVPQVPTISGRVSAYEDTRRAAKVEYCAGFSATTGEKLFENRGGKSSATISWAAVGKRGIITHNHPRSMPFSGADIRCAFFGETTQMRVSAVKADYTFKISADTSANLIETDGRRLFPGGKLSKYAQSIMDEEVKKAQQLSLAGKLTENKIEFEGMHNGWHRIFNENELFLAGKYSYERRLR